MTGPLGLLNNEMDLYIQFLVPKKHNIPGQLHDKQSKLYYSKLIIS